MPEFSGDRNYQGHHTRIHLRAACLSVVDQYEKGVVLTHWLSGMLQPQCLTGPYLPWADSTVWYASVIFVRKKRHCSKRTMRKKTDQQYKLTSLRFMNDHDHLLILRVLCPKDKHVRCSCEHIMSHSCVCSIPACGHGSAPDHLCLHAWTGVHFGSHAVL